MDPDKINIRSKSLKIPYVLLERCTLNEINGYKWIPERNGYYLIEPESEEINEEEEEEEEEEEDNNDLSLIKSIYDDFGELKRAYVLLERLSPNDIQHLLNKKN